MKRSFWVLPAVFLFVGSGVAFADAKSASLESIASITPILELSLSRNAQSELRFGNVGSSSLAPVVLSDTKTIQLEVLSNTGEKYILTQSTNGPMQNASGDIIALENLSFRTQTKGSTGTAVSSFTPVTGSTQTLFSSDDTGAAESVTAEYQLSIPPSQAPGEYSTLITYTVSSV
jgi:hypothetical protein